MDTRTIIGSCLRTAYQPVHNDSDDLADAFGDIPALPAEYPRVSVEYFARGVQSSSDAGLVHVERNSRG